MKRMRFSIAGLMGFVVVAALGMGGLKAADENWASGCYTLVVATLILAVLTALQFRGRNRAYWAGFAIAGWVYFGVVFGTFGPFRVTPPHLLTEVLFDRLEAMMHPNGTITYGLTGVTATVSPPGPVAISGTLTGSVTGSSSNPAPPTPVVPVPVPPPAPPAQAVVTPLPAPAPASIAFARPPGPWLLAPPTTMSHVHFSQIAHSLVVLMSGMLGGIYSAWLFGRRERREDDVTPSSP